MSSEDPDPDRRPATEGGDPDETAQDDGYVHDPSAFGTGSDSDSGSDAESAVSTAASGVPPGGGEPFAEAPEEGLGRRGWALLSAVVLAFFGAPAVIYLRPPGVPFEVALLVVPLLPAFGLGVIAVWAMAGRR